MGRPSDIGLTVVVRGGALQQVRVAGGAVPVSSGQIRVP
jgi:predicted PhzF superfamily epimerase YddE/YHI9